MSVWSERVFSPWRHSLEEARAIYVGYSGGLDSSLLLSLAVDTFGREKVRALHADHALHPQSGDWLEACRRNCEQLGVVLISERLSIADSGLGPEGAAREQRYRFFENQLRQGEILLLAHHADDQVETLLYRLLRGAGTRGLSGMPRRRALGAGELIRPLLPYRREELRMQAEARGLRWIEDPSNRDIQPDRNYLRHRIVPALLERWPDAVSRILQTADHMAEAEMLLEDLGREVLAALSWRPERWGYSFDETVFVSLDKARQKRVLMAALREAGGAVFQANLLERMTSELLGARLDAMPKLALGELEVRRFAGRIYLGPSLEGAPMPAPLDWDGRTPLEIPGSGKLMPLSLQAGGAVRIGFRSGGERACPLGHSGSRPLKKLLLEYGLEPWLRERLPLLYIDGELVAAAGLFTCRSDLEVPEFEWSVSG